MQHRAGHGDTGEAAGRLAGREQFAGRARGQHGLAYRAEPGAEGQLRGRRAELGSVGML